MPDAWDARDSWEVSYPPGLMKYIDYFRLKYFQYEVYDRVLADYIERHKRTAGRRLLSLGCGTGHHEVELAKLGFDVVGMDRNEESLYIARQNVATAGVEVALLECDFLSPGDLGSQLDSLGSFDVAAMLMIPLSSADHRRAALQCADALRPGGIFVTGFFGYADPIDPDRLVMESGVEVADGPRGTDFAVRLNYHEYHRDVVEWDAVYLFYDEESRLQMARDHDVLEVIEERMGADPLEMPEDVLRVLPSHRIVECQEGHSPPHLYEYLVAWRRVKP